MPVAPGVVALYLAGYSYESTKPASSQRAKSSRHVDLFFKNLLVNHNEERHALLRPSHHGLAQVALV